MRILVLSNLYPPNGVGGYEALCASVTAGLVSKGHRVTVLTSGHGGGEAAETETEPRVLRSLELLVGSTVYDPFPGDGNDRASLARRNVRRLGKVLDAERFDVVLAWNLYALDDDTVAAVLAAGVPVCFLLTDNWLLAQRSPDFLGPYMHRVLFDGALADCAQVSPAFGVDVLLSRKGTRLPARAIFPGEYMRALHEAGGVHFAKTHLVPHGTAGPPEGASSDEPSSDEASRELPAGRLRLLFAGRLVRVKGPHVLIDAIPEMRRLMPDRELEVVLMGDTRDRAYVRSLEELARSHGCRDVITFRGTVPESEFPSVFADHDVFVFPSLYEPFSLTLIDALKSGIPVVASRTGGNRDLITDGRNGLLYDPHSPVALAERVHDLVRDPTLGRRLSRTARPEVAGLTLTAMIDRIDRILVKASADSRGASRRRRKGHTPTSARVAERPRGVRSDRRAAP